MNDLPFFSIIIPTFRDWDHLSLCLKALESQTLPKDKYEIIVVNNAPGDNCFFPYIEKETNLYILNQAIPGSYASRNKGIQYAKGDILAFTDSDCIPEKDWLKNALSYFSNEETDRLGGKINLFYQEEKQLSIAELFESIFAFRQEERIKEKNVSVTANLFVKSSKFDIVGFFDETKLSGEDTFWNERATKKGLRITYADDVIVNHPARYKVKQLINKERRTLGGAFPYDSWKRYFYLYILLKYKLYKPVKRVFRTNHLLIIEQIKLLALILYLFFVNIIEWIRLMLFGHPKRV